MDYKSERSCAATVECTYRWVVTSDYDSGCSSECGLDEYIQTRTVECWTHEDNNVDDSRCDDILIYRPSSKRTCPATDYCSKMFCIGVCIFLCICVGILFCNNSAMLVSVTHLKIVIIMSESLFLYR